MESLEIYLSTLYGAGAQIAPDPSWVPVPHQAMGAPAPIAVTNPRSRCGRKPFGFFPGETAVIQRIMELRAQGLGFDKLADQLSDEMVRSRSGKPWHGRVVNRIVRAELAKR